MTTRSTFPPLSALGLACLLATGAVQAQAQAQARPPDSGQILQQQTPRTATPAPSSNTGLTIQRPAESAADSNVPFQVTKIEITGNTLVSTDLLHQQVASSEGRTLTLTQLNVLAARITRVYHQLGYPLDSAYVPAQTLSGGVVRIAVVEARYGTVSLDNQSTVSDYPLRATLSPLSAGAPVEQNSLDRSLLLLSDIPGVIVSSVLRPGTAAGTSDLAVTATPAPRYSGTVGLDNFGNTYTGRARFTGTFDINSLLHQGDVLDVNAITSGADMSYGRVGYKYLLNGQGTTIGASVSALSYRLGNGLQDLHAHGTAQVQSIYLSQPIIRSATSNLYGQIEFDHKRLNDDVDVTAIDTNRHTDSWTATLAGDHIDDHGNFNYMVSATHGDLRFDNDLAQFIDAISANTAGSYNRYNLSVSRLQTLSTNNALYVGFTDQWASKNLDSSEQFFLGGPNTVRGYDVGELTGAQGNLVTIEFRHHLELSWPGAWQVSGFVDSGHVEPYKTTFVPGPNSARMNSAGLGLNWNGPNNWLVSASISVPVGNTPALLNEEYSTRFWLQVQKGFAF